MPVLVFSSMNSEVTSFALFLHVQRLHAHISTFFSSVGRPRLQNDVSQMSWKLNIHNNVPSGCNSYRSINGSCCSTVAVLTGVIYIFLNSIYNVHVHKQQMYRCTFLPCMVYSKFIFIYENVLLWLIPVNHLHETSAGDHRWT